MTQASRAAKNFIYQKLGKFSEMIQRMVKKMDKAKMMIQEQDMSWNGPKTPYQGLSKQQIDLMKGVGADQQRRNRIGNKK